VLAAVLGGAALGYVLLSPYRRPELPSPTLSHLEWTSYSDERIGFSIAVPAAFTVDSDEDSMLFRLDGTTLVHVGWLDEATADARGLWADHEPVSDIMLGGRPGKHYVYNHYQLFRGARTHAWVVPHRGRYLAVEIRTRRASMLEALGLRPRHDPPPGEVGQRILASFRFLEQAASALRGTAPGR
jgi:hypothetical protein